MFTGIITAIGVVRGVRDVPEGRRLTLEGGWGRTTFVAGEAINLDGAAMTVVDFQDDKFQVEVGEDALATTMLSRMKVGHRVNLERAIRAGDRVDGHFVLGRIDGIGTLDAKGSGGRLTRIHVSLPVSLMRYVIPRGSIAIAGVGLTIDAVDDVSGGVECVVAADARRANTLAEKEIGAEVNVEVDMLARYAERVEQRRDDPVGVRTDRHEPREGAETAPGGDVPDPTLPPDPGSLG